MCSEPITTDGQTFACRTCNECISTRKNDWVARCMAEKATSTDTMVIDLTYRNNEDGTLPDGAKAFNYRHIQLFMKSLRKAYKKEYGETGELSYIVAGERGSRNDRVHWHLVIFGKRKLSILGKWMDFWFRPIPEIRMARMLQWSMWPHGHVYPQIPDQGGMQYVLKYALKDQFNSVKSRKTMRFTKSEDNGASYFRMSKVPPIGARFLDQTIARLAKSQVVLPKTELKIPEYSGFWWPKGQFRERLLMAFHNINEARKARTGKECPQWNTLLSTVVSNEKDWETLIYGEIEEEGADFDRWTFEQEIGAPAAKIRNRCGNLRICAKCWQGKPKEAKADYRDWYQTQVRCYITDKSLKANIGIDRWFRRQRQINPFCTLKDLPDRKEAFKA